MPETPAVSLGADGNVYVAGAPLSPAQALRVLDGLRDLEGELRQRSRRERFGGALTDLGGLLRTGGDLPDLGDFTVTPGGDLLVTVASGDLDRVAGVLGATVGEEVYEDGAVWRTARRGAVVFRAK